MHEETRAKMIRWLGMHPDSSHPLDTNRYFDAVREACIHDDNISYADICDILDVAQSGWSETRKSTFAEKKEIEIEQFIAFYRFCIGDNEKENEGEVDTQEDFSFQDFYYSCFDLDHHEIFELACILDGQDTIEQFFSVEEIDNDKIRLTDNITDSSIVLSSNERKVALMWLEENIMDGLDADSWYGFKCALEKAKEEDRL